MKKAICVIFLFSIYINCFSQIIIKGSVIDQESKIQLGRAGISVLKPESNKILKYTFTDAQGNFKIELPVINAKEIQISVNYLGYEPFKKIISYTNQELGIELKTSDVALREVKIKPKAITQKGDTITYNPLNFEKGNDITLADVLKRLPGIEITPNGQIKYQDKPINKFYIEGLDLLNGKYNLATENMPKGEVEEISLYQNHQPIKALQDKEFSENAALNIKLKNKSVLIGSGKAGLSHNLKYGDANFTPMIFSDKIQFLSSSQFNNSGKDLIRQLRTFDVNALPFLGKIGQYKLDLLNYTFRVSPNFETERLRFNTTFVQSINILKKLRNDFQLKTNINAYNEKNSNNNDLITQFYTPDRNTILLNESQTLRDKEINLEGLIDLEKNAKTFYLKNSLSFNIDNSGGFGENNNSDEVKSNTKLSGKFYHFKNTLHVLMPLKKQNNLEFFSSNSIVKNNQKTISSPIPYFFQTDTMLVAKLIQQNYENDKIINLGAISHSFYFKRVRIKNSLIYAYDNEALNSSLTTLPNTLHLLAPYSNSLDWKKNNIELNTELSLLTEQYSLVGKLGLNKYYFNSKDESNNLSFNKEPATLEPSLYFYSKFKTKLNFTINLGSRNTFGNISNIFPGYILTNSSMLSRNNGQLLSSRSFFSSCHLKYSNAINGFFANAFANYSLNNNDLMTSTQFLGDGSTQETLIENNNRSNQFLLNVSLSKSFFESDVLVKLSYSYSNNVQNQLLNTIRYRTNNSNYKTNLKLTKSFTNSLYFDSYTNFSNSNTSLGLENSGFSFSNFSQKIESNYVFENDLGLVFSISYSAINNSSLKTDYFFSDLSTRVPLKNKKVKLRVDWQNIFNAKKYYILNRSNSFQTISILPLRASQLLVSVDFSL